MKNLYCAFLLVIMFTSCSTPTPNEAIASASDSIIVRVINPEFFITEYDTIKNGRDLLWNFSLYEFEDGTQWRKWVDLNPVLQEPGRVWKDPATGRWIALVKKGEILKNPQPVYFTAPSKEIVTQNTVVAKEIPSFVHFLIVLLVLFFLVLLYFLTRKWNKDFREYKNEQEERQSELVSLRKKLEETENKLPIKAPVLADEEWLSESYPAGNPIPENNEDTPRLASSAITRAYGKKPDLIVQARVSTAGNTINMSFSHDREATTGLTDVVVYLGWNWDLEKKRWTEVGMLAGPCSNGFEATPGKVKKSEVFTKMELVNKNQHPVIFIGDNVPKNVLYPKLVRLLVLQYHENNITDLRTRTGTMVEIPEGLKPGN